MNVQGLDELRLSQSPRSRKACRGTCGRSRVFPRAGKNITSDGLPSDKRFFRLFVKSLKCDGRVPLFDAGQRLHVYPATTASSNANCERGLPPDEHGLESWRILLSGTRI